MQSSKDPKQLTTLLEKANTTFNKPSKDICKTDSISMTLNRRASSLRGRLYKKVIKVNYRVSQKKLVLFDLM
jgi:hypothetical protein